MKRLVIYPATFLILIAFELMLTTGFAFHFEEYNIIGWAVQILLVILCIGGAEHWVKAWKESEKQ